MPISKIDAKLKIPPIVQKQGHIVLYHIGHIVDVFKFTKMVSPIS